MRRSRGISPFIATLILVAIALSLSYAVYEGVSRLAPPKTVVYSNQVLTIGGSPAIEKIQVNASSSSVLQAVEADSVGSPSGILYFDGTDYGTTHQLCLAGATTFFSVLASTPGRIEVASSGQVWIDGVSTDSLPVTPGWQEVMISDASSCSVTSDGQSLTYPGEQVSTIPIIGSASSTNFTLYLPTDGTGHSLVLVFDGGHDRIA
jgi:flagellin-like protein